MQNYLGNVIVNISYIAQENKLNIYHMEYNERSNNNPNFTKIYMYINRRIQTVILLF